MNRTSIKIIKRQDAELMASGKTRDLSVPKLVATTSEKRGLHRMMADTVSNWVTECRENNRAEEVLAIRRMFTSESFLEQNNLMRGF